MRFLFLICICNSAFYFQDAFAQTELPLGAWRVHTSGFDIQDIQVSSNRVVAASKQAVFILHKQQQEINVLSKLNRLSSSGISSFAYDEAGSILLVGYTDGNIDLVTNQGTLNFPQIRNANINTGKRINDILIHNNIAYLSSDFGVVVFDIQQKSIRETIREIGAGGTSLRINKAVVLQDSIFLATARGVLASRADGTVNLLDFNNWKRMDQGLFNTDIKNMVVYQQQIWGAINGAGIFSYQHGAWTNHQVLASSNIKSLSSGFDKLLIIADDMLYQFDTTLRAIDVGLQLMPNKVVADADDVLWIADAFNGIIKKQQSSEKLIHVNGPLSDEIWNLTYTSQGIAAVRGAYNNVKQAAGNPGQLSIFSDGLWKWYSSFSIPNVNILSLCNDIVALLETGKENPAYLISCFGNGVHAYDKNWNAVNIPGNITASSRVVAMKKHGDKIWMLRYDDPSPLISYNTDGSFSSYSFSALTNARYVHELSIDMLGQIWMTIDPSRGGGIIVFDPQNNRTRLLSEQSGNGSLPDNRVYAISPDRNGQVWIGTAQGVCFFPNPGNVFDGNFNAVRPIFENRFLLRDQRINAIAADGGNRKWISSDNGVWLFSPDAEQQVYFFDASNSPLQSSTVKSITIEPFTGEVFFATTFGLASFRSDATEGKTKHDNVKIYPNPVTGNFAGTVGISGLATDVNVKITDVNGRLVHETRANGGTATWNVRDFNGRRVGTGIYLVFSASADGKETHIGKIAVVN